MRLGHPQERGVHSGVVVRGRLQHNDMKNEMNMLVADDDNTIYSRNQIDNSDDPKHEDTAKIYHQISKPLT